MMVDVAYGWSDAQRALRMLERLAPFDLFFMETPLDIDDLDGYAYLHDRVADPDRGGRVAEHALGVPGPGGPRQSLDVLQPDIGRVGGFTEARKVARSRRTAGA